MRSRTSKPTSPLLWRLLELYERRKASAGGVPLARDVVLKVDHKNFPEAWAPDGADERESLFATIKELERAGAIRVVYGKGVLRDVPQAIRLGETEIEVAYRLAESNGFRSLFRQTAEVEARALALRHPSLPPWMNAYLEDVARSVSVGNVDLVPVSLQRLRTHSADLIDALAIAAELATRRGGMERVVSERATGDSKRLESIRGLVREILVRADPRWQKEPPGTASEILASYGIRRKPAFLYCAGGLEYPTPTGIRHLVDDEPSAAISEALVPALSHALASVGQLTVTTIENETPYHLYVEEMNGPRGLARQNELVIYSAGFPSDVVQDFLTEAARVNPRIRFRHWGDPDAWGFEIWWFIRSIVGREVQWFRSTPDWIRVAAQREARALSVQDQERLAAMERTLYESSVVNAVDVVETIRAIETVRSLGKWIEQERYFA